ncbi:hypothetical protein [Streptomyces sp. NPDC005799]|uniref:hypothetical protein n=1 Tax=Streptomyces sp. NPDC005799 TaxID=3154678 RepID=UPI0033F03EEB
MDAVAKRALVKKLAVAVNFHKNYAARGREWFIDRLIREMEAEIPTPSDAVITSKVTEVVTKSKAVVKGKENYSLGIKLGSSLAKIQAGRRIEILYGIIASHSALVEPANGDMLDWIARRRLRGVTRMDFYVNPNTQGYFRYPDRCPAAKGVWRLNVDAQPFWGSLAGSDTPAPGIYYFPLKRPAGGDPDYLKAISKVFTAKENACDGNLVDCGLACGAVLLDTLVEAKDAPKLLKKVDSRGPKSLGIHSTTRETPESMILDTGTEGLFERGPVLVDDLQVGDHAYIFNHPLYKVFKPTGSWTGEHSLVYGCGDRGVRSRKGIYFGGHGKEGTVYDFYDDFLAELQTHLHRSYRIAAIFLNFKKNGSPAPSISDATTWTSPDGSTVPLDLHQFDVGFRYRDFQKTPTKAKSQPEISETGFAIGHFPTLNVFLIAKPRKIIEIVAANDFPEAIPFERPGPNPGGPAQFEPTDWKIVYKDRSTNADKHYDLFTRAKGKLTFQPLTIDELFDSPFAKPDPKKEEILATRPRVDTSAAYLSFLRTNGAM